MMIGRKGELKRFSELYLSNKSHLVALYGRRRVGKSFLIQHFCKDKLHLRFEGIENEEMPEQIKSFTKDLYKQINDPLLKNVTFENWTDVFDYITRYLDQSTHKKSIIFFDELQWLCTGKSSFVALFKKYWDQEWKNKKVLMILCGSISSFMVKKVIKSKALYGRIDWELNLQPLPPFEAVQLLRGKRNIEEAFKYLLIFGGIPRYLEQINLNRSFEQNIGELFLKKDSPFLTEYEKIFYAQFREHRTYEKIVQFLSLAPHSLDEISEHINMKSSGGVKSYLDNLINANFIAEFSPYDKFGNTKLIRYKISDEYLRFYFKFIQPKLRVIKQSTSPQFSIIRSSLDKWLGLAFEGFCQKNAMLLAEKMNFSEYVTNLGPWFVRGDVNFQVDLVYFRNDKTITLCEIKYHDKEIDTDIINEIEDKCKKIKLPRGFTIEKALISIHGPTNSLKKLEYFSHFLVLSDFLSEE